MRLGGCCPRSFRRNSSPYSQLVLELNFIKKKQIYAFLWFAVYVWVAQFLLCKDSKEYFNRSPWCKATWFDWPIQQLVGFHVFRDFGRPHRRCWTDRDTEQGRWSAHCQKVNILVEIICSLQISCFKLVIHQQLLAHGVNTLNFQLFLDWRKISRDLVSNALFN